MSNINEKEYTSSDIQVLSDRDHVRLRLPVYLGNTNNIEYEIPIFQKNNLEIKKISFIPAVMKCVNEILDNSVDEFNQTIIKNKKLVINYNHEDKLFTISDNGRGVPITVHKDSGIYTPELVFSNLRSGRNFNSSVLSVNGMNGLGSSLVAMVSSQFIIDINRDNKNYHQIFNDGCLTINPPVITKKINKDTGTLISFKLDNTLFQSTDLPEELIKNRANEIAINNPDVTVIYNKEEFKYKNGFDNLINNYSSLYYKFSDVTENHHIDFYILFDNQKNIDEKIFTWVNNSLLYDGGICNTQFLNAFYDKVISHLSHIAKKSKCDITKNDIRQNLLIFGFMKIKSPEYDSQAKTRLTGPTFRKEFDSILENSWSKFVKQHKEWFDKVLQNAISRHNHKEVTKALKDQDKKSTKKIEGLMDATSKIRRYCKILITEGLSASAMCSQVRDPETMASFPLTGKINNVYGKSHSQLLKMGKITDLLLALGLVPGRKADMSTLRYGKILIATDADSDGDDIMSLLVNLFYQYWPELFDPENKPIVYRLLAPNVIASKGKQRIHFVTKQDYEKVKEKYRNWTITYCKGLGSMEVEDWKMLLDNEECLLPIVDIDNTMKETLELLFGPSADSRKEWLVKN